MSYARTLLQVPQLAKRSSLAAFWRTDWFAGVTIVLAAFVLHFSTDFVGTLERRFYDFASTSNSRQPSERIAVIAIDDQSIANIGRWPWQRDVHAKLIDLLAQAKAKTIVQTALFLEPQLDPGLGFIRKMHEVLGATAEPGGPNEALGRVIAEAEAAELAGMAQDGEADAAADAATGTEVPSAD